MRNKETLKPSSTDTSSPNKTHHLIIPQTVSQTRDQALKYITLLGPFSFKPPHVV